MAKGNMSIELLENDREFEKIILNLIQTKFATTALKSIDKIKQKIKPIVFEALNKCPEIKQLKSGTKFRAELGLKKGDATSAADSIAKAVSEAVSVTFDRGLGTKDIKGGILLNIQPRDYQNVLNISKASVFYKPDDKLDWLDWLLNKGDSIIVSGFHFAPVTNRKVDGGRTGLGTMKQGGNWRIDPVYAGTPDDNFITRALRKRENVSLISAEIFKVIMSNWK